MFGGVLVASPELQQCPSALSVVKQSLHLLPVLSLAVCLPSSVTQASFSAFHCE
jgi:hypothetical protein